MRYKAIIVGAGPGGSSAAISLGQRGIKDVLLIDRSEFPREKTCGSGLSPNALKMAEELGVAQELAEQATPIHSVKIVTPGGRSMVLASNAAAVVLLRRDFDYLLHRRALSLGVKFEGGERATDLLKDEHGRARGVRLADGREFEGDVVLCADGAHSIFSNDPRPKRSISTLMGWWENMEFEPGQIEMIFAKNVSPLYGWLFPETETRVNIGICIDGQDDEGGKTTRKIRDVFAEFLQEQFGSRMSHAKQLGKLKGHPIVYSTWITRCTAPGALFLGEAARLTHNATGEGISQAMQSGAYAAEAAADVLTGRTTEKEAWQKYLWRQRRRFTAGFLGGHALRAVVRSPVLDALARAINQPLIRRGAIRVLGSALAGSAVNEAA